MPKTVQIRETTIDELRRHAGALMVEHYAEVGVQHGMDGVDPDWDQLRLVEQADSMVALAAWVGDELAGYAVCMLCTCPLNRTQAQLESQALFVGRDWRQLGVGAALMHAVEAVADENDAQMRWTAKRGTRLERILESRKGYALVECVYRKERGNG